MFMAATGEAEAGAREWQPLWVFEHSLIFTFTILKSQLWAEHACGTSWQAWHSAAQQSTAQSVLYCCFLPVAAHNA